MIMNNSTKSDVAILYSFRRCPFAMRARAAIYFSKTKVELREVLLRDKPQEMLNISSKGTVPVLKLKEKVIDESIDIMLWALNIEDTNNLLNPYNKDKEFFLNLIYKFDQSFKYHLDRYKYSNRYLNDCLYEGKEEHKEKALFYLKELQIILKENHSKYLYNNRLSILDLAIFPLVRQFKIADPIWFNNLELEALKKWLDNLINSIFFKKVMYKYDIWNKSNTKVFFHKES